MSRVLDVVGIAALALGAVLAATITALLTPLYWGSTLVPLAVGLAIVANVVFPVLARRLGLSPIGSALPFGLWLITVLVLASSRPEGDVLLPAGNGAQPLVTYGMLLGGVLAGGATVARLMATSVPARGADHPADSGPTQADETVSTTTAGTKAARAKGTPTAEAPKRR